MEETTLRLSAEQAASDPAGKLVLTGSPDSPATTVARARDGSDALAKSEDEALKCLGGAGHRYAKMTLIRHAFPDAGGAESHSIEVWAPEN